MERRKVIIALAMLVAAALLFIQVKKMGAAAVPPEPVAAEVINEVQYSDVLVAKTEIPFGQRITSENLMWKQWPTEALAPELITKEARPDAMEEYIGGVNRSVIYEGEPITGKKIVISGTQGMMASILTPGMRAVAARISAETTAGGFIQPGDYVDIIMTTSTNRPTTDQIGSSKVYTSSTVFANVRVLAIDQNYSSSTESGNAAYVGSTATFEMTQSDAELLRQAVEEGDLTLTLRPIADSAGTPGRSTARIKRETDDGAGSVYVYRYGEQQQVAIRGQ